MSAVPSNGVLNSKLRTQNSELEGLRVLDLTNLSGAYAGKLLSDLGAVVTRLESPEGDPLRRLGRFVFEHYHGAKRMLALDVRHEREAFLRLAAEADVLIETGELAALGQGAAELAAIAPRLVVISITPFGKTGPYRDWRSSDTVAQAMGGMAFVNGHPGEAPLRGFGLQAYHSAATYAAIAAILALLWRERSGRGQHVDVSIQACVAATVEHVSSSYQQSGTVEERRGTLHWSRCFRVGACRDGYVMHCILGDWPSLLEWVKGDGKAQDLDQPQWEDFAYRKANCEHLFDVLDAWAADQSVADLVEGAQLRRVPYAPVLPLASLADDPQLRARGFFDAASGCSFLVPRSSLEETQARVEVAGRASQRGTKNEERGTRVLSGVRVIDFTWVVAGPVATRILADQGAEVIKIERRDSLDYGTRRGGLTGNLNRGKESVVLDLSRPEGLALARDLIAGADVLIDNFSARVLPNWGLDEAALRRLNPSLIAVGMSGFGRTGPYRDYVSYGPTLQALTGFTSVMRHPGGEPAGWGFSYSDMAGGYNAALAVLAALWRRRRTGAGQFIDLSQFESLASLIGAPLLAALAGRAQPEAAGNDSLEGDAAPHGIYRCADRRGARSSTDRWCAITVFGEDEWRRFVAAIGSPAWAGEPRFASLESRLAHRRELDALVEAWGRSRDADEVMHRLQAAGVAAGIVADAEDLCERDPQLRHRGYWVDLETPEGERVRLDGVPFRLSDVASGPEQPGPLLGEHTDAVLRRVLGLDDARVAELRALGAIG